MIPTVILKSNIKFPSVQEACTVFIHNNDKILHNLKNAIYWALDSNEDVIYCICEETDIKIVDILNIEEIIHELLLQKMYLYFVDSVHKEEIPIDSRISLLSNIHKVKSFIVTKPFYQFLLSILNNSELLDDSIETLFNVFVLHPITINPQKCFSMPLTERHIHVIAPFRNIANYIHDFIKSIENQKYNNFTVYFIDDASDDGTVNLIPNNSNYNIKINKTRKYAVENVLSVLLQNNFGESDIICLIDPDDYLPHGYVFRILNNVHSNISTLITYGTMVYSNSFNRFGQAYYQHEFKSLRKQSWRVAHMKTFKFKVFKEFVKLDPNYYYLKDEKNTFLKMPCDMAFMFPMMEICGFEGVKFIETILYEYRVHENNDINANRNEQYQGELVVRNKKRLRKVNFVKN